MSPELVDWVWKAGLGLVAGLVLYVVKERRKVKLENDLAEQTQQPRARKVGIEALESQILAMSTAWDYERASKDRQISELEGALRETRAKLDTAEGTISELRRQARSMQNELDDFKAKLSRFEERMQVKEKEGS